MLAPVTEPISHETQRAGFGSFPISVEDALRLPVDATINSRRSFDMDDPLSNANRLYRLNESLESVQHGETPSQGLWEFEYC